MNKLHDEWSCNVAFGAGKSELYHLLSIFSRPVCFNKMAIVHVAVIGSMKTLINNVETFNNVIIPEKTRLWLKLLYVFILRKALGKGNNLW